MDETYLTVREARSVAIARRVLTLSPADQLRMLTFLAGMVPAAVEQALQYVEAPR